MFKNKKDLTANIKQQINVLLKINNTLKVVYTELKNNNKSYEEVCLLFEEKSQTFIFHYWFGEKVMNNLNPNTIEFKLLHHLSLEDTKPLCEGKVFKKAEIYLKKYLFNKLRKNLHLKNSATERKVKI